jgi:hypothetical protein
VKPIVIFALLATSIFSHYAPPPPAANLDPVPDFNQICAEAGTRSNACFVSTLDALDYARRAEGLGPLYLPRNWRSLTGAEQVFVITNLERIARSEQPIPGLTRSLNQVAYEAAVHHTDPVLMGSFPHGPAVSIWAESPGPLASDYDWMYFDGFNGPLRTPNLACQTPKASGCWGHRNNILAEWSTHLMADLPEPWYLVAGAAEVPVPATPHLSPISETMESDAMIVTAVWQPPHYVYTWRQAVKEGAGSRTRGWNPAATDRMAIVPLEALARIRTHAVIGLSAAVAGLMVWFGRRPRRRRRPFAS